MYIPASKKNLSDFRQVLIRKFKNFLTNNLIVTVSKTVLHTLDEDPIVQMFAVAVASNPKYDPDLIDSEKWSLKDLIHNQFAFFIALHRSPRFRSFEINTFAKFDCLDFKYLYVYLTSSFEIYKYRQQILSQCSDKSILDVVHKKTMTIQMAIQHTTQLITQNATTDIAQLTDRLIFTLVTQLADLLDAQTATQCVTQLIDQIANGRADQITTQIVTQIVIQVIQVRTQRVNQSVCQLIVQLADKLTDQLQIQYINQISVQHADQLPIEDPEAQRLIQRGAQLAKQDIDQLVDQYAEDRAIECANQFESSCLAPEIADRAKVGIKAQYLAQSTALSTVNDMLDTNEPTKSKVFDTPL
jgi:hypothetical protein